MVLSHKLHLGDLLVYALTNSARESKVLLVEM